MNLLEAVLFSVAEVSSPVTERQQVNGYLTHLKDGETETKEQTWTDPSPKIYLKGVSSSNTIPMVGFTY